MSKVNVDKNALVNVIIKALTQELAQAISAANDAHSAATDDQSVAETQYDTLAIEASYLAEGQSRRIQLLQTEIKAYQQLRCINFINDQPITLSALVQLSNDTTKNHWFFFGPAAGGFTCTIAKQHITVITPQSPMGAALLHKQQDDDIEINLAKNKVHDFIVTIL